MVRYQRSTAYYGLQEDDPTLQVLTQRNRSDRLCCSRFDQAINRSRGERVWTPPVPLENSNFLNCDGLFIHRAFRWIKLDILLWMNTRTLMLRISLPWEMCVAKLSLLQVKDTKVLSLPNALKENQDFYVILAYINRKRVIYKILPTYDILIFQWPQQQGEDLLTDSLTTSQILSQTTATQPQWCFPTPQWALWA